MKKEIFDLFYIQIVETYNRHLLIENSICFSIKNAILEVRAIYIIKIAPILISRMVAYIIDTKLKLYTGSEETKRGMIRRVRKSPPPILWKKCAEILEKSETRI